jgi:hypothetical protein
VAICASSLAIITSLWIIGWQFHETIKKIHRGDYFDITGRSNERLAQHVRQAQ